MKITEINEWDRDNAIVDKKGNILCPICKKNLAQVSEYGMLRKCDACEKIKDYNVMVSIDEPSGRITY